MPAASFALRLMSSATASTMITPLVVSVSTLFLIVLEAEAVKVRPVISISVSAGGVNVRPPL